MLLEVPSPDEQIVIPSSVGMAAAKQALPHLPVGDRSRLYFGTQCPFSRASAF
jgi:hypothetical protein